jgi:hypothetical protein
LASAELYDPASGTFNPTGSMQSPRGQGTATLLLDGRVLVTGGSNDSSETGVLATAELYDPASGKFSPTGSMSTARSDATATLLSDGRVLVAGGLVVGFPPKALASAELYDPATGKFNPTGSMTTARWGFTATRLTDGRVLVAGGYGDSGLLSSAELYDPASGTFSPTGSMTTARLDHAATRLTDGRVLIAGGDGVSAQPVASAELYDPATGKFNPTGSMAADRGGPTATLLTDGRVLVAGGYDGSEDLASAELYDPASGTFSSAGSMGTARSDHTATLLSDGRVLVAGGEADPLSGPLASAELFQP